MIQKVWRALHFVMCIVKKENKNTKTLAYMSPVHPILEYGVACWDPYRECQISALDHVQNKQLNLRIIWEAQTGNLWHGVGRQRACVNCTKRISVRGRGKR